MFKIRILLTIILGFSFLSASDIKNELPSQRSHFSKTFSLGNSGYRVEYSANPIHYRDENGNFIEIPEDDDGTFLQIALTQLFEYYSFTLTGSYALLDSVGGDTVYTVEGNSYVGSAENYIAYEREIHRQYTIFPNEYIVPPQGNGDVIVDSVEISFDPNSFISSSFGTLSIRAGLRSSTETFPADYPTKSNWESLAEFGSQIASFDPGSNPTQAHFTHKFGTGPLVSSVESIFEGNTSHLNFIVKKQSESFAIDQTHYISLGSIQLTVEYHIQAVTMTNIDEDNGDANLGSWLSLYKNTVRDSVASGDPDGLEVFEDQTYSALTHKYNFGSQRHRAWNDESKHKVKWSNIGMTAGLIYDGLEAKFKSRTTIDLSNCLLDGVTFHDPWYITNEDLINPESWIQPDTHIAVASLTPSGNYSAFRDQTVLLGSYYSLSSPKVIEDSTNEYLVFYQWSGTGLNYNGSSTTSNRTTPVVFTAYNAAPVPNYHELTIVGEAEISAPGDVVYLEAPALIVEGGTFKKFAYSVTGSASLTPQTASPGNKKYSVSMSGDATITLSYTPIGSGDIVDVSSTLLAIPSGTQIAMPSESQINLYDPTRFAGSPSSPVVLSGASGVDWHGLRLVVGSDVTLENLVIENAIVALWTDESLDALTLNNVTVDSAQVGFDNLYDYGDDFSLTGAEPTLVEPLYDVRITNSNFTNVSQAAIQIQGYELGNLRIDNCNFTPQTTGQGTAIKAGLFDGVWYTAEEEHEPFDSLQILNNDISGFESGIVLQFNESLNSLDWATGAYERVMVQDNEISNCDTGIVSSGEMLLFSNHNVIDNCDVGHSLDYVDLPFPSPSEYCDKLQYRILNETIVGDGNSIGIYDSNPNLDEPYQTLTTFVGACILANHDTAAFNSYATVFHDNILYDNSTNFVEGFVGYYNCWEDTTNHAIDPQFVDYANGDYRLLITSPAIDAGYVDFDGDGTDYASDTDDQDSDGSRMDVGAFSYPSPHTISSALTITTDTEWYGKYAIEADVTVASGATLTILPGSILEFKYFKEDPIWFTVNGDLKADGLPDAQITFTSSAASPDKEDWYGIVLNSTVNDNVTILDNCIMEYGKYGVTMNGASADITNNIVRHNMYGIYVRNGSNPDITSNRFSHNTYGTYNYLSSPTYTDNLIDSNSSRGMYHNGSSTPRLYNNTIQRNTGNGIYMYNHADVQFGHSGADEKGLNEIVNNSSYGIYASYYCDPFLGTTDPYNQAVAGYNSIHDNGTYNLRTYNHSTAEAEHNWWDGETTWSTYYYSSYDVSPTLGSEPSPNLGSSLAKGATFEGYADCPDYDFFAPDTSSECALWYWAHDLRVTDQIPVALRAWELYIQNFPDSENAVVALVKIANYTPTEDFEDLSSYFYSVLDNSDYSDQFRVKALELLIGIHIKSGDFMDANTCALSLLDQALCSDQERIALFSLIDLNQFALGKATAASGFLQRMKEEYPNEELTLMAAELMGEEVDWSMVRFEGDHEEEMQVIIPEKFALYAAYPNPFNPVTTIRYDLPKESQVQLTVYDISGRVVTTLVSKFQDSGSYNIQWNGMDVNGNILPSGLYLYRIQAGKFVANEKMLLLK